MNESNPQVPPLGISFLPGLPQCHPVFTQQGNTDSKEGLGKGEVLKIFPGMLVNLESSLAGPTQALFLGQWNSLPPSKGDSKAWSILVSIISVLRPRLGELASCSNLGEEEAREPPVCSQLYDQDNDKSSVYCYEV